MNLTRWLNPPPFVEETSDRLVIQAGSRTDYFIDIQGNGRFGNAHLYLTEIEGDFILSCRVKPEFKTTYDAGGLFVRSSDERWIKHGIELTDLGYPSVVGVVTDGVSDDANGERVESNWVWLRICRKADNWCLLHSGDGQTWKMSRYFRLNLPAQIEAGLIGQSPMGDGCRVEFEGLSVERKSVNDLRKGY